MRCTLLIGFAAQILDDVSMGVSNQAPDHEYLIPMLGLS